MLLFIRKQHGFILLVTLFFLQIFSLCTLAEFMLIRLNLKSVRHRLERSHHVLESLTIFKALENDALLQLPDCMIPAIATQTLVQHPITWWKRHGCSGAIDSILYYYILESLGSNPCQIIEKIDENHNIIANYYRITFISLLHALRINKIVLQSTIVTAKQNTQPCTDTPRHVKIGRQIWREL